LISKTRMLALVKAWSANDVQSGLAETPALREFRDERGRSWLHLCCGVDAKRGQRRTADGIATAEALLRAGLGIDDAAFTEGAWRATPLWYAIARGQNLRLAKFLLERGAGPNHCLWAAAFNDDVAAVRLLVAHGADIDPEQEDATPFLFAVQWSRFAAAEALLKLGADPNCRNSKGMTALHYLLKKGSDEKHVRVLARYGARADLPDRDGATAADIIRRKRNPQLRALAAHFGGGLSP
jgi:hypothetical protein